MYYFLLRAWVSLSGGEGWRLPPHMVSRFSGLTLTMQVQFDLTPVKKSLKIASIFAYICTYKNQNIFTMKKLLLFIPMAIFTLALFAQSTQQDGPVMTFESETIDYGTIEQDADGAREFKFTNTGTAPLIINNCQGTCGCTVPNCMKEPILPGESGVIGVKYATNRLGQFNKAVKVYSNATPAEQPITIHIKGNVLPKPGGSPDQHDHSGHTH